MKGITLWKSGVLAIFLLAATAGACAQDVAKTCRERADELGDAASRCRSRVASGDLTSCVVRVAFRNDAKVSIEGAESLAREFRVRASEAEAAEAVVSDRQDRIALDLRVIGSLGLSKRAEDFEAWGKLAEEAKKDLEMKTLGSILSLGLMGAEKVIARAGSLTPFKAQKIIGTLQSAGVTDPYLIDAIRALSRARGKPELAATAKKVIEALGKAKDAAETAYAVHRESRADVSAELEGIATALSWLLEDPPLQVASSCAQYIAGAAYDAYTGYVSNEQVEMLRKLTEAQLKSLDTLGRLLRNHVYQLRVARQTVTTLQECK
jgi:hypothetical protein